MGRRTVIALAAALAILMMVWGFRPKLSTRSEHAEHTGTNSAVLASPSTDTKRPSSQIDPASLNREELRREVRRRDAQDSKWEWEIPIKFYGKVVDDTGQPVPAADVHFQWTTLSTRGTGEVDTQTDSQGRFALEGVHGKRLLVRLSKPGYDPSDARNKTSFEYAIPSDEMYHEPYAEAPIVFHLRKQKPSPDVVSKSTKVMLQGDAATVRISFETGKPRATGELLIVASKPWPPRPMSPSYDWNVGFHIENGGFVDAPEQFAFEAPESGYVPDYTVDMRAALGSGWKVNVERTVYFVVGQPKRYGRLTFRTDGNSRYIFLYYVINRSGSRNLEALRASH